MAKLRKMLGKADSPYIISLMHAIETQSKETIAKWCMDYCEEHILPIFEAHCPEDGRPRSAINAARDWFDGKKKLPEVKHIILNECHAAARELEHDLVAQAAAIAYERVGLNETPAVYDCIAASECAKMEEKLRLVSVENETNPAKINWNC